MKLIFNQNIYLILKDLKVSDGSVKNDDISGYLFQYIENNSERLREKYTSLIQEVGEYQLNGKSIVEHLSDHRGYNLWWMSKIFEKSQINSPQIVDCIKVFALEEILSNNHIQEVFICGFTKNNQLTETIERLCSTLNIRCVNQTSNHKFNVRCKNYLRRLRPEVLSVSLWLFRYLKTHYSLRRRNKVNWFSGDQSIIFFSYFFALDVNKCMRGEFYSKQWSSLPKIFDSKGVNINWIHHFMVFEGMNSTKTALGWIERFNKNSKHQGIHDFFESHLSFFLILVFIKNYIRSLFKSFEITNINEAFRVKDSAVDLWPLLKNDWIESLRGGTAARNLIFIELVDKAIKHLPYQKNGLYLQENQFWEMALINAWRANGHGTLIGVPHATVNFWDMRYANDKRTALSVDQFTQPKPDLVALHGPVAKNHFIEVGYPSSKTVEVEALRYLNIGANKAEKVIDPIKINILVVGELKTAITLEMLSAVLIAVECNEDIIVTFKPHPGSSISAAMINNPSVRITTEPLDHLIPISDIAIVSGSTSAAVDVYYSDINTIIHLGSDELNLSPLREFEDVTFTRSVEHLKMELSNYEKNKLVKIRTQNFFWTESALPRWVKLIKKLGYISG
jgi:surface carbohydrate biosynthesis protein (TIGR04326 family)